MQTLQTAPKFMKPKPKRTSRSLDQASTDELLAELAKRSDDDDLAFAATEAAELARKELEEEDEEDDEEDDEGALPLYRPHGQFAERVVIVGAGPGGLSAAVYAARAGLAPVVIAPSDGGQLLGKGVTVENYPGIVQRPFVAYPGHASLAWRRRSIPLRVPSRVRRASRRRRRGGAADLTRVARRRGGRHGPRPRPQDAGPRGRLRRGVLPAQGLFHRPVAEALPRGNAGGEHLRPFIDSGDRCGLAMVRCGRRIYL